MSLNAIAFLGSTPIGAPLLGYLSDTTNPRVALVVGGVATLLAAIPLFALGTRQRMQRAAVETPGEPGPSTSALGLAERPGALRQVAQAPAKTGPVGIEA
jgi:hypothetical protein